MVSRHFPADCRQRITKGGKGMLIHVMFSDFQGQILPLLNSQNPYRNIAQIQFEALLSVMLDSLNFVSQWKWKCTSIIYKLYWSRPVELMRYLVVCLSVRLSVCKQFLLPHLLWGYLSQRLLYSPSLLALWCSCAPAIIIMILSPGAQKGGVAIFPI